MKIQDVKTAFKIADVIWDRKGTRLSFKYLTNIKDENDNDLPQSILTENVARVYLIVVNDEIYKIGGSQDKGGMKKTLRIYQDGGIKGRPSIRSFGVWYFLFYTIANLKAKIEIYMIYQENFTTNVKGLSGFHVVNNAAISYKLMEECCINDFRNKEGAYPKWNIQEQGADWPLEIKTEHANITKNSLSNLSKRKQVNI